MGASGKAAGIRGLGVAALAASSLILGACGGTSPTSSTSSTGSAAAPTGATVGRSAAAAKSAAGAHYSGARHDPVTNGTVVQHPFRGTGGHAINDDNPGRADSGDAGRGLNPCSLVTRSRAQAILGKPIAPPQEAPLGPTCIYQVQGAHTSVTLVVESLDLGHLTARMRGRKRLWVAGHVAYCGFYGQQLTVMALPHRGVLQITAPCQVGAKFAAAAAAGLKA